MIDLLSIASILVGLFFYLAGTIGLIRLPDTLSRLHAVTKADNLGLGFLIAGLCLQIGGLLDVFKMLIIWLLVLATSAAASQLIARYVIRERGQAS